MNCHLFLLSREEEDVISCWNLVFESLNGLTMEQSYAGQRSAPLHELEKMRESGTSADSGGNFGESISKVSCWTQSIAAPLLLWADLSRVDSFGAGSILGHCRLGNEYQKNSKAGVQTTKTTGTVYP